MERTILADRTHSTVVGDNSTWHTAMKQAVRDPRELCRRLGLPESWGSAAAARDFPVFAPLEYIARMKPGDPYDPLLRQVLPIEQETEPFYETPGFNAQPDYSTDPTGDLAASPTPGLLHKYHGRVLLIVTGACAIHCRYCFRRHFPYSQTPRSAAAWRPALEQIADDGSIEEVILSGGDPLTLTDSSLAELIDLLADIPHVRRLRVHTRLPIVIPKRVTPTLIELLCQTRLISYVVVHANHPAELGDHDDDPVAGALSELVDRGIVVFNQAVLLRGINDNLDALVKLCRRLIDLRVTPYYLHQLDRVMGAAHFEVPVKRGLDLMEQLRARLPGYAVPQYVRETPGHPHKLVLT